MPVADVVKNLARGIGMAIPGVSDELALQSATNARQRTALANMIEHARQHEAANFDPNDPESTQRLTAIQKMQADLQSLGPFDSPKKIHQAYGEYVSNHPLALGPINDQPQAQAAAPGPARPGNVPGAQQISVPSIDQSAASGNPPGAAPATSPVQPARQGGSAASSAGFPSPGAAVQPIGDSGTGSDTGAGEPLTSFSVTGTGASPNTPGINLPTLPSRPMPRLPEAQYTGQPELSEEYRNLVSTAGQLAEPGVRAQSEVDAKLSTLQGTEAFQNANAAHKIAMIKDTVGQDQWDALPNYYKTEIITSAFGVQTPGIGAMAIPRLLTPGATGADLMARYPNEPAFHGLDPTTIYRAEFSPLQGAIATPVKPEIGTAQTTTGGLETFNKRNPTQVTPIPGAVGPSFVGTGTAETSLTDPSGRKRETRQVTKTAPKGAGLTPAPGEAGTPAAPGGTVTAPAAPKPSASAPGVTSGAASKPYSDQTGFQPNTKIVPFNPRTRLDGIVQDIAQDEAKGMKEITNANDKFLVTQRMHELGLSPANLTTSMRDQATRARQVLTHLNDLDSLLDEAAADKQLSGNVNTYWNKFLTQGAIKFHIPGVGIEPGKFTFSTDPSTNQIVSRLYTDLGFLATAVGMTHGGMKGGSSEPIMEHWEKILTANDIPTMRARLGEAKRWMQGYASMMPSAEDIGKQVQTNTGIQPIGAPTAGPGGKMSVGDWVKSQR